MHMFLQFVDSLSVMHIQILGVFRAPPKMDNIMAGGLSMVLEHAIPALQGQRDLYDQLWNELVANGLLGKCSLTRR
jgi:hypothetical protein